MSVSSDTGFPLPAQAPDQTVPQGSEVNEVMDICRQIGSNALAPVPQMVFIGDLSANKARLIEALTGVRFPRDPRARPNYPIEVICRRSETQRCSVHLRACFQSVDSWRTDLSNFVVDNIDPTSHELGRLFTQVTEFMNLRRPDDFDDLSLPTVGEDVMTIHNSGPDLPNLTLLDVPGIFEDALAPLQYQRSESMMAQSILGSYINPQETLLLVALPCALVPLTERILDCMMGVDPHGLRTIVLLTKPKDGDVQPNGIDAFQELYRRHLHRLRYPFFLVTEDGTGGHRVASPPSVAPRIDCFENQEHSEGPTLVKTEYGFACLRKWLSEALVLHTTKHYHSTVARVKNVLDDRVRLAQLLTMEGLAFLEGVAIRFRALIAAENNNDIVSLYPFLRITPRMYELQDVCNHMFFARGHTLHFDDGTPRNYPVQIGSLSFPLPNIGQYPWVLEMLPNIALCACPQPTDGNDLLTDVARRFVQHRRVNRGTVEHEVVIREALIDQMSKWRGFALWQVSNAILVIHQYIDDTMRASCPCESARGNLMHRVLVPELRHRYTRALEHAELLVEMEVQGPLLTCSPMFSGIYQTLADKRAARASTTPRRPVMPPMSPPPQQRTELEEYLNPWPSMTEEDLQVCEKIHDMVQAHYIIAGSRLLDNIFKQSIDLFLFRGPHSAVHVFSPQWVGHLDHHTVAGTTEETDATQEAREILRDEIAAMHESLRVLRSLLPAPPSSD